MNIRFLISLLSLLVLSGIASAEILVLQNGNVVNNAPVDTSIPISELNNRQFVGAVFTTPATFAFGATSPNGHVGTSPADASILTRDANRNLIPSVGGAGTIRGFSAAQPGVVVPAGAVSTVGATPVTTGASAAGLSAGLVPVGAGTFVAPAAVPVGVSPAGVTAVMTSPAIRPTSSGATPRTVGIAIAP